MTDFQIKMMLLLAGTIVLAILALIDSICERRRMKEGERIKTEKIEKQNEANRLRKNALNTAAFFATNIIR